MRKEKRYSNHHILPRSQGGNNSEYNLESIPETQHRAIHTLFENKMIAEQLIRTIDISKSALREDVREWLLETLMSRDVNNPYEWYDDKVIL